MLYRYTGKGQIMKSEILLMVSFSWFYYLCTPDIFYQDSWLNSLLPGGEGVLPCNRLLGKCCWMGLHFTGGDNSNKRCLSSTVCKWKSFQKSRIANQIFCENSPKSTNSRNFIFITSCFPGNFFKSPDSWKNFAFLLKQPFLELTPPSFSQLD